MTAEPEPRQQRGGEVTSTVEARVRVLEEQVEILRRALGLSLVGCKPAMEWADAQMQKARDGEFRYTKDPVEVPATRERSGAVTGEPMTTQVFSEPGTFTIGPVEFLVPRDTTVGGTFDGEGRVVVSYNGVAVAKITLPPTTEHQGEKQ